MKAKTPNEVAIAFNELMTSFTAKARIGPGAFSEQDLTKLRKHWEELQKFLSSEQASGLQEVVDTMEANIRNALGY